jgi:hypothetical protein|tara:strand:+ start:305 stop:694 length:390 start_codon:yes stop_codon:yes gene_type:complete
MTNRRWVLREETIRELCLSWLSAIELDEDNPLEILVKPYKKNRSLEQNDMFHAWCGTIADKTGHSKQEIKQIMVESTFGAEEFLNLQGRARTRLRETSGMKVGEMSELLERTIQIGIELGAEVPEVTYG